MLKNKKTFLLSIIFLSFVLSGCNRVGKPVQNPTPTRIPPTSTPKINSATGWKIIKNKNFIVELPQNLEYACHPKGCTFSEPNAAFGHGLLIIVNQTTENDQQLDNLKINEENKPLYKNDDVFKRTSDIKIGEISAKAFINMNPFEYDGKQEKFIIQQNDFFYLIEFFYKDDKQYQLGQQILSTFKITN